MHRSGTSAIAGVLEGMGLSTGNTVMPKTPDNPLGFHENTAIVEFHERMLDELGSTWHDPRPLGKKLRSLEPERIAAWRKELAEILDAQFAPGLPALVKDPRLCRLLPVWEPVIAESGIPLVIILRHPAAVAASLSARDGFSTDKALLLWLVNNLEMERQSRAFPRAFFSYSGLLRHPVAVCHRLQQSLNLPAHDFDSLVRDRVHSELCHHDDSWPAASPRLRDWCQAVFEILQHDQPEQSVLDGILHDYDERIGWLPDDFSGLAEKKLERRLAKIAPAPKSQMQVFADQGRGFCEQASIRSEIVCDEWQTIRIRHLESLRPDPASRLRIDPSNYPGQLTLSQIRIFREADGANLYLADTEEEFRKIEFSPGLIPYFEKTGLVLLAMDRDPQMLLPCFGPLGPSACVLEMKFRVDLRDVQSLRQTQELRQLREAHGRLNTAHEALRAEREHLV